MEPSRPQSLASVATVRGSSPTWARVGVRVTAGKCSQLPNG